MGVGFSSQLSPRSSYPEPAPTCKAEKPTGHGWSPKEENFLIAALKELVAIKWRGDNGFKMGYQQRLEAMIRKAIPGTNIRQNPHINSKLQTWKKQHGVLSMILGRSGVGFNSNGRHMIECEDDQWDQIVKIEPYAKSMRYKLWPLLDDWDEIFGKERANGDNAKDIGDAATDNYTGDYEEQKQPEQESASQVDLTGDDDGENSACNTSSKSDVNKPTGKGKGKKRKQADPVTIVADVISELGRSTGTRLDTIAKRMGYDFDMDESRMDAYNSLKPVVNLSQKQRFEVATIFVKDYACFLLYKGLPPEEKSDYVQHLLNLK